MKSLRVKYPLEYRVIGWFGLLIGALLYLISWSENSIVALTIITGFVLLSLYALIEGASTIEMTTEMVIKRNLFGAYGIKWDEVETIQYCVSGDWIGFESMLFEGENKRLSIAGPSGWTGKEAAKSRRWFYTNVRKRGLEIKENVLSAYKFTKNARLF